MTTPIIFTPATAPRQVCAREIWRLACARLPSFELHFLHAKYTMVVNGVRHELGLCVEARRLVREKWPLPERTVRQPDDTVGLSQAAIETMEFLADGEWRTVMDVATALRIQPAAASARLRHLNAINLVEKEQARWRRPPHGPRLALVVERGSRGYQAETLAVLDEHWKTTQAVADELGIDDGCAYQRLKRLTEQGLLESERVRRISTGRPQLQWRRVRTEAA